MNRLFEDLNMLEKLLNLAVLVRHGEKFDILRVSGSGVAK